MQKKYQHEIYLIKESILLLNISQTQPDKNEKL